MLRSAVLAALPFLVLTPKVGYCLTSCWVMSTHLRGNETKAVARIPERNKKAAAALSRFKTRSSGLHFTAISWRTISKVTTLRSSGGSSSRRPGTRVAIQAKDNALYLWGVCKHSHLKNARAVSHTSVTHLPLTFT